ncbi:uroporphyrinogen decarboxylase family protein [Moorella stamsii]|uniref:uroporphyrinogen decarboxylase family protein n=1 Tax=Neomoorella stamsii TaxID=1266720 RepID=UPI0009F8CF9A|nr:MULTISPECIES: uroporphyrinogen decarboxylase family protein [Moorella]
MPCSPSISEHVCRLIGVSVARYCHSSRLMAETHIIAFKIYQYDSVGVGPNFYGLAEAMGARLRFSDNDRPQLAEPAIRSYSEISHLEPVDAEHAGRLPLYLEALEIINESIGHQVPVGTGIGGPFTTAAFLRGVEDFLKDLRRNPEFVHSLLQLTTRSIINYIEAARKRGFSCSIGDPLASASVISPRHFREFVKPYLTKIAAWVKAAGGSGPSLHICGDTRAIWADMADTGVSAISLDNQVSLEEAKRAVGTRVALKSNVAPVEVLLHGTRDAVLAAAKECIRQAFDNPKGFILGSGCSVALNTPPDNILALMEAARIYGRMPIDPKRLN